MADKASAEEWVWPSLPSPPLPLRIFVLAIARPSGR